MPDQVAPSSCSAQTCTVLNAITAAAVAARALSTVGYASTNASESRSKARPAYWRAKAFGGQPELGDEAVDLLGHVVRPLPVPAYTPVATRGGMAEPVARLALPRSVSQRRYAQETLWHGG